MGATHKLRIVVIEDDDDNRLMLETIIKLRGHEVSSAPDARAGLALALTSRPDVIFLDLGLPDMDGLELAGKLRPALPATRLVALTGRSPDMVEKDPGRRNIDEHLVKPATLETLEHVFERLGLTGPRP